MDFNFKTYQALLAALQSRGFSFLTVSEYAEILTSVPRPLVPEHSSSPSLVPSPLVTERSRSASSFILLRHDVEARYENALHMARIQHSRGIKGTYYFRIYGNNGHGEVIREIAALGHEIGYHYDDLSHCKGNYSKAIKRFEQNLNYLRQFGPVTSATMEGAPLSPFDNRDLWKEQTRGQGDKETRGEGFRNDSFHYNNFGILTEPYFDFDFNQLYYLTDTGRRWDGHLYNVRDKATKENPITNPDFLGLRFHSTRDIIKAINESSFPNLAMLNFHPQRWNDNWLAWTKELVWQNVKNQGKRFLVSR